MHSSSPAMRLFAPSFLLVLASCAWSAGVQQPADDDFPWLQVGTPVREVTSRLGPPSHSFEDGRILCFLVAESEFSGRRYGLPTSGSAWIDDAFPGWKAATFDVVVVIADGKVADFEARRLRR